MMTLLRKHRNWLMIVIAILAIPFVFYFNKTDLSAARAGDLGRIYDRPITRVEFQRNARMFNLARDLGMYPFLQDLVTGATSESDAYAEFTWNRIVLRHEAERLGIRPTADEIEATVKTLQPFRNETGFDINKYSQFTQTTLPTMGFGEAQIEEIVSDQLSLNRLKDLLGTGAQIAESESKENYEKAYGKMDVAVVRLRAEDFAKEVKIGDEDIAKYYESHKAQLKSEEKRRVEFVSFALSEEEKKKTGKERVDAMQKLANQANDFTQALLEKEAKFADVAGKFQTPVRATGEFAAATPDPVLASDPQLAKYAFQLTPAEPNSDPIQGPDGFAVLHLLGISEARALTLEESKAKIVEAVTTERRHELVSKKGAEVARLIREAIKAGTPLEAAIQPTGQKLERILPFSLMENPIAKAEKEKEKTDKEPPKDAPDLPAIKNAVAELSPGEASDFIPADTGGLVAVLEKRAPIDPSSYEMGKVFFESRYVQGKRSLAFFEWLHKRREAAGLEVARS